MSANASGRRYEEPLEKGYRGGKNGKKFCRLNAKVPIDF